jgi:uncharacterized membrane protein YdjX (TVP38/TMEM64 family)
MALSFPASTVHWLWWVVFAAAVDAGVGVLMALLKGKFDLEQVGHWLVSNVLLVVVPVAVVALLSGAGIVPSGVFAAAAATALATLLGGIANKIGVPLKMAGGNSVPSTPPPQQGQSTQG